MRGELEPLNKRQELLSDVLPSNIRLDVMT